MKAILNTLRRSGLFTHPFMRYTLVLAGLLALAGAAYRLWKPAGTGPRVLIYNREEFASHPEARIDGAAALAEICKEHGLQAVISEEPEIFTDEQLSTFAAVVFVNTTGDVLNYKQEAAFQRYIQAGGGFMGVHAAVNAEHNWAWYHQLLGAYFDGQSEPQPAVLTEPDAKFGATRDLPSSWELSDEWFNLRDIDPEVQVVLSLDENSYHGGTMGAWHPAAWYREFDGGRSFYTMIGHSGEVFEDPAVRQHLLGGLRYVVGDHKPLQYHREKTEEAPAAATGAGFTKTDVVCDLYEPMELDMFPDGKILLIERMGTLKLYNPAENNTEIAGEIKVFTENEQGLIGLAIDPQWSENHWIYLFYAPLDQPVLRLSRFEFRNDRLVSESEQQILEAGITRDAHTYHCGGNLEFDTEGNLFISIGDDTDHYNDGFTSTDERPGKASYDSQKSASNTMDLRGKILRIRPLPDGSYVCPAGNLFADRDLRVTPFQSSLLRDRLWLDFINPRNRRADALFDFYGRPEIYVMGCRNPFRISLDPRRRALFWGDVGPDAGFDDDLRGPEGYDELNMAQSAGFYGWPYAIGENRPYRQYDFGSENSGAWYDLHRLENTSPNNTGARYLPYPRPALIWYPFRSTELFPEVANGTRCVMAGPTYYADQYPEERRFPAVFDGRMLMYDWMRGWILAVEIDSLNRYKSMEPFADKLRFSRPMDMLFDSGGSLWVLDYGTEWFARNPDACLSRIDYIPGPPGAEQPEEAKPVVEWDLGRKNRSFFRRGDVLPYRVLTTAQDAQDVALSIEHVAHCSSPAAMINTYRPASTGKNISKGKSLIDGSDCKSCHDLKRQVNGPSYEAIAGRYENKPAVMDQLAQKIIKGGGGVWGGNWMSAHPQLSDQDVRDMVHWILEQKHKAAGPPLQGRYTLAASGAYIFHAAYGNGESATLVLHDPLLQAEHADERSGGLSIGTLPGQSSALLRGLQHGSYFAFRHIDLRHVRSVQIGLGSGNAGPGYAMELHCDSPDGRLLGKVALSSDNRRPVLLLDQAAPPDFCDLFFVLKKETAAAAGALDVDWVEFNVIEP